MFFIGLVVVVLGVPPLVWWAHRRHAVLRTTLITLPIATIVWLLDLAWINSDPTGAGGAFDCWPNCSFEQDIAQLGFWLPPVYVVALLIALAVRTVSTLVPGQRR